MSSHEPLTKGVQVSQKLHESSQLGTKHSVVGHVKALDSCACVAAGHASFTNASFTSVNLVV